MSAPGHQAALIVLRRTQAADVPTLFALEQDERCNALAGTKPRDWPAFQARWAEILADQDGTATRVMPRVILEGGVVVGAVNISPQEEEDSIGYVIAPEHWGRGIATRAVALMLAEFTKRPLFATTAATNLPSLRVLKKNGFAELSRGWSAETPRCGARETVKLVLR